MQFVADESVDAPIYRALRQDGHQVYAIVETCPGIQDDSVLGIAFEKKSILITQDKDFGELVYRLGKAHFGILLLRLSGTPADQKAILTLSVIREHQEKIYGAFTVVFKNHIKIRKKPVL